MRVAMPTFSGGEIGPGLQSRFDTAKYQSALRYARNVLLAVEGGFYNRGGFRFVGATYAQDTTARLIPFQFSLEQSYVLELGDEYMRVIYDGGLVLEPEVIVTAITKANPAVATIPDHGLAAGDDVYFVNIVGMTQINDRVIRVLSVIDADNVRLDINSTAFSTFTGSGGGVAGDVLGGVGGKPPVPTDGDPTPPFEGEIPPPPILTPWDVSIF